MAGRRICGRRPQKHALLVTFIATLALAGLARGQLGPSVYITHLVGDPAPAPTTYAITMSNFYPLTGQIQLSLSCSGQISADCRSGSWLSASLSSPTVPSTLTISVNPVGIPVGTWDKPAGYIVQVNVNSANQAGPIALQQWSVFLTVISSTTPAVTSILNAASFSSAPLSPSQFIGPNETGPAFSTPFPFLGTVSAGEIVSIFGSAFGPTEPFGIQIDSTGKVATEIGGLQVLFGNVAAPLIYVSATQINCVVPYEIYPGTNGLVSPVQIKYLGQTLTLLQPGKSGAQSIKLTEAVYIPGIFTATGTGTGQAAALNSDNTPNTASNPAPAGSIISVYMTGEGQTSPPGVTGSVTCSNGCTTTSQIPKPLSPVAALVGGQPATVTFYGEAPGLVSGVMQVNVLIPPNTPPGTTSLAITLHAATGYAPLPLTDTQPGVTIAVK